jgi:hypothetical protein
VRLFGILCSQFTPIFCFAGADSGQGFTLGLKVALQAARARCLDPKAMDAIHNDPVGCHAWSMAWSCNQGVHTIASAALGRDMSLGGWDKCR